MSVIYKTLSFVEAPLWVFDIATGTIPWANKKGLEYWCADNPEELANRNMLHDISTNVHKRLTQYTTDCAKHDTTFKEYWTIYPDGAPRSAEVVFSPFVLDNGREALLVQLLYEDVATSSDSVRSTQALMHTTVMISLYDADLELIYSNPAARAIAQQVHMSLPDLLVHSSDLEIIMRALEEAGHCEIECEVKTLHGVVWHAMSFALSPDAKSGRESILLSSTDVTERRMAQKQALKLAYTDSLTDLPNRIAVINKLEDLLKNRKDSKTPFSLLFIDLDRFKLVNDSLGHTVGDQLLVKFAKILKENTDDGEFVGRLSGDEFVVICTKTEAHSEQISSVRNILDACTNSVLINGHMLRITPSIGIANFPEHGTCVSTILPHADLAMYTAKRLPEHYAFYETVMEHESKNKLSIENDIVVGIQQKQFELCYQPKVSAKTGEIVGAEVLVRWNHPVKGLVSPADFIPVAEETGLIVELGYWILKKASADQVLWEKAGFNLPVSINISPKQFLSTDFSDSIIKVFNDNNTNPEMIELEITESVLIGDKDFVLNIMDELHAHGVMFSIDDFGTGYSNLAYLKKYPLDSLKIDKAFIDDISDTALLEIILSMAKILNLHVVAEGVETSEQVRWLAEHDCDEIQGYFFSKPVPLPDLMRLFNDQPFIEHKRKYAA